MRQPLTSNDPSFKTIDWKVDIKNVDDCILLFEALKKSTSVKTLDLNNLVEKEFPANHFSKEPGSCSKSLATSLSEMLKENKSIKRFCFSGWWFGQAEIIADGLQEHPLEEFSGPSIVSLLKAMERFSDLKKLETGWGESDDQAASVASLIRKSPQLTSIHCSHQHVGVQHIISAIKSCLNLKKFELNYSPLGNEGAQVLAEAFSHLKKIEHIDLLRNEIGPEGALALVDFFKTNMSLKFFSLQFNPIGDEAKTLLNQAAATHPKIKTVHPRAGVLKK